MTLDNAITSKEYYKVRKPVILTPNQYALFTSLDTETKNVKLSPDNINPFAQSSTQEYPLGSLLIQGYRKWRYCKAGGSNIGISVPVQMPKAVHAEQDDDIVVAAAAAVGDTSVWLTSTANLDGSPNDEDNAFAGGFLIVNDVTGEGQCRMIRANAGFNTTQDSEFELYDPLTVALTTSSQVGLIKCPYNGVIATEAVVSGMVVGVPQISVTASYFFWCQTFGPAAVVAHAAVALGTMAIVGTTAAKADPAAAATTEIALGEPMTPGVADTEKFIVFLRLD